MGPASTGPDDLVFNISVDTLAAGSSLVPWLIVNSTEVSFRPCNHMHILILWTASTGPDDLISISAWTPGVDIGCRQLTHPLAHRQQR